MCAERARWERLTGNHDQEILLAHDWVLRTGSREIGHDSQIHWT